MTRPTAPAPAPFELADASPGSRDDRCRDDGRALRRRAALAGAAAMAPWLAGVVPFGLVVGVTAADADLAVAGWLSGPALFAGSAQLALLDGLAGGAPVVAVLAAVAVNLRLALYSASLRPAWSALTPGQRAIAAAVVVDPTLAVATAHHRAGAPHDPAAHHLGAAAVLWVAWVGAITVGVVVGAGVPEAVGLSMVVPLFLLADVSADRRAPGRTTVVAVAAAVAVTAHGLPGHVGPVLAVLAGVAVGAARTPTAGEVPA